MKNNMHKTDSLAEHSKILSSKMDDTEKSLLLLSREFKKIVRSKAVTVKKIIQVTLGQEMAHINENSERLIHGKA